MNIQRNLIFVRHAQSIGNVVSQDERALIEMPNYAYPLTPIGREQARLVGEYIREKVDLFPKIFMQSTFLRSQEVLTIILEVLGMKTVPITDSRLDEKWDGIFHDLSKKDIDEFYPKQRELRKKTGYYHYRAPGGENCPDVELRIRSFFKDYFESYDSRDALVVGHGRWFQLFQKLFHNLTIEQFLLLKESNSCENASVTIYRVFGHEKGLPKSVVPWIGKVENVLTELA